MQQKYRTASIALSFVLTVCINDVGKLGTNVFVLCTMQIAA